MDKYIAGQCALVILGTILGIFGTLGYQIYSNQRAFDGLYIQNADSHAEAVEVANDYEATGDYVCVNVNGMSYERAIEVCKHEVGHEIFAEIIEDNPEKISEVMEVVEK